MLLLGLAPFAVLLELDLSCDELLVLAAPVVYALAASACELDEFVLGHSEWVLGTGIWPRFADRITIAYIYPNYKVYRIILGNKGLIRVVAS